MITVKGVEVRPEEVNLEMNFQDLTIEGQRRLFKENPEFFAKDVLDSEHFSVRRLILEVREKCSSNILNKAIATLIKEGGPIVEDVIVLLNTPGFELDALSREFLACSRSDRLRIWVAKDKKTPFKMFKGMFYEATVNLVKYNKPELFDAIVTNPQFKADDEEIIQIIHFSNKNPEGVMKRIEKITD